MSTSSDGESNEVAACQPLTSFRPTFRPELNTVALLPDELWMTVVESPCTFPPDVLSGVMFNLIKNPNITSSHLFRADIFYDSESDLDFGHDLDGKPETTPVRQLKSEYQLLRFDLPGCDLQRTIVRQLIPRNPQLDRPLVQTCHFFTRFDNEEELHLVLYMPHIQNEEDMPFYHPAVSHLAFVHKWKPPDISRSDSNGPTGSISISYRLFPNSLLTTRLERTALRLLQTVHKHGEGQLAGYEKRVHLDQVIPQKRYQDTYARLKAKYGKQLAEQWVEVTDPGKHVFEDIAIAAFLIELWRDMYAIVSPPAVHVTEATNKSRRPFPGFVDIGCGNGVLLYILRSEGYEGWGFDARERKTWGIFPDCVRKSLQRRLLVPHLFQTSSSEVSEEIWHDGIFKPGTFIISNHADELTAWTPLLAYLNQSSFIAIPCCSHDLAGTRFRAPASTRASKQMPLRLPQHAPPESSDEVAPGTKSHAAETGSLKRTEAQKKMPSAYSTLCSYVTSLAEDVGYEPEREVLRIPSTRNQCIVGRQSRVIKVSQTCNDIDVRKQKVHDIVERELGRSLAVGGAEWIERARKLVKKPGSGH